jgi:hypothetical protein
VKASGVCADSRRPRTDHPPSSRMVSVRLTSYEYRDLEWAAGRAAVSMSEVLRMALRALVQANEKHTGFGAPSGRTNRAGGCRTTVDGTISTPMARLGRGTPASEAVGGTG